MLGGFEIIEDKYIPENVVLISDRKFFYWIKTDNGEITKIKKSDIFNPFKPQTFDVYFQKPKDK